MRAKEKSKARNKMKCPLCDKQINVKSMMWGVDWRYIVKCCGNTVDILSKESVRDVEQHLKVRINSWRNLK